MNQKQLQELKDYLINHDDFYQVYDKALQDNIDKSLLILSDIVFNQMDTCGHEGKRYFNHYVNAINQFITYINEDYNESTSRPLIDFYIMDSRNQGVAWLMIEDDLFINIDDLYDDWDSNCNG